MKTIEQLLELSNNPYYTFTNEEKTVLDDFLSKKQDEESKSSRQKKSSTSEANTPVRVRNVVPKMTDDIEFAPELSGDL